MSRFPLIIFWVMLSVYVENEKPSHVIGHVILVWVFFQIEFMMGSGVSVTSGPVETFSGELSTWDGCNFPVQVAFIVGTQNVQCRSRFSFF